MKTPINNGLAQSDIDVAGFDLLNVGNWPTGGGGGTDRRFDVKTYGAAGNGTTDDTGAIQAALAAIPATGGVLYFPAGKYKYAGSTLLLDKKVVVEGDGGGGWYDQCVSQINFDSATGTLFQVYASGSQFRNICLNNPHSTPPTAGAGILVSGGAVGADGWRTTYENLSVHGFYIGINVLSGSEQNWDNCLIGGCIHYSLRLTYPALPDGGDHAIVNCWFAGAGIHSPTAAAAIRIESGGGPKITNSKIIGPFDIGIDLAVADNATTVDLLIANNSIETFNTHGFRYTTGTNCNWWSINLTGNQFGPYETGASEPYGIYVDAAVNTRLIGLSIIGNLFIALPSGSANPAIYLANCQEVVLEGNSQQGFSTLYSIGSGVTFADSPVYIGRDARLVSVVGGAKLQVRNASTGVWGDGASWTNP